VNDKKRLWVHAARVAMMATAVVLACYAVFALGLRVFVTHRLIGQADARLRSTLSARTDEVLPPHEAVPRPSAPLPGAATDNGDLDDVPVFTWDVPGDGRAVALSVGAPALPRARWGSGPVTRDVRGLPFRFLAERRGTGWVVVGESIVEIQRVDAALVLPEVAFGVLLGLATFVGSLLVALRASVPLETVRRRQAEFTADASHELRTPLSVVEAEVDLALHRRRPAEEYEAVLRRIGDESRRLRRIVDDLLWLARADAGGGQEPRGEVTDVSAVAEACVGRFQAVAARLGVSLSFAATGQVPATVDAAGELVDRLVGVLVDNACTYAGEAGRVEVHVRSSASKVALRVDDSGPGIPETERERVFDRFHRATPEGSGSGLGLAIADSVVRRTGGTWSVGRAALGGARMEVTWRRVPDGSRPPAEARTADRDVHLAVSSGP